MVNHLTNFLVESLFLTEARRKVLSFVAFYLFETKIGFEQLLLYSNKVIKFVLDLPRLICNGENCYNTAQKEFFLPWFW